jgi:hypothetical protein
MPRPSGCRPERSPPPLRYRWATRRGWCTDPASCLGSPAPVRASIGRWPDSCPSGRATARSRSPGTKPPALKLPPEQSVQWRRTTDRDNPLLLLILISSVTESDGLLRASDFQTVVGATWNTSRSPTKRNAVVSSLGCLALGSLSPTPKPANGQARLLRLVQLRLRPVGALHRPKFGDGYPFLPFLPLSPRCATATSAGRRTSL